jgi:hypothetical protein
MWKLNFFRKTGICIISFVIFKNFFRQRPIAGASLTSMLSNQPGKLTSPRRCHLANDHKASYWHSPAEYVFINVFKYRHPFLHLHRLYILDTLGRITSYRGSQVTHACRVGYSDCDNSFEMYLWVIHFWIGTLVRKSKNLYFKPFLRRSFFELQFWMMTLLRFEFFSYWNRSSWV